MKGLARSARNVTVRSVAPDALDEESRLAWLRLEQYALDASAFLSADFVLPALRHLDPDAGAEILLVERDAPAEDRLIGVLVLVRSPPSRQIPFPHLQVYRSIHSFSTGVLVDRRFAAEALSALLAHIARRTRGGRVVEFSRIPTETYLFGLMRDVAARRRIVWREFEAFARPVLFPRDAGIGFLKTTAARRLKDARRHVRMLESHGPIEWRIVDARTPGSDDAIARFLDLEHLGWKADSGSSLKSNPAHERFFTEMAAAMLRRNRACFVELVVGGTVVASNCMLFSANAGFGFKLGWDPAFAKMGPGSLTFVEITSRAPEWWSDREYIDSCVEPGSNLESLWTERRRIATGAFVTSRSGYLTLAVTGLMRAARRSLRRLAGRRGRRRTHSGSTG